ncbi:MAG: heme NO-binding domain-containing protein [Pseudomonadota bacterium]
MYGMINKAVKDMVLKDFGASKWSEIMQISQVSEDSFLTLRIYDDDVTYSLVGAAADVLELPVDQVLDAFGVHWVMHAAPEHYDQILIATGNELIEFLKNVNGLHDRITTTFVDYRPPWFELEHISEKEFKLHYHSGRSGLSSFVRGLIRGLGQRFETSVEFVDVQPQEVASGEHTTFHVKCATN